MWTFPDVGGPAVLGIAMTSSWRSGRGITGRHRTRNLSPILVNFADIGDAVDNKLDTVSTVALKKERDASRPTDEHNEFGS